MKKRGIVFVALALVLIAVAYVIASPSLKRKAESDACGNSMLSLGIAARMWAGNHDGHLPSELLSMEKEVITPKILVCPGDHLRQPAANWSVFAPSDSSYEIVAPALPDGDSKRVFLRCKIHGHLGYADGTVLVHGRPHHK